MRGRLKGCAPPVPMSVPLPFTTTSDTDPMSDVDSGRVMNVDEGVVTRPTMMPTVRRVGVRIAAATMSTGSVVWSSSRARLVSVAPSRKARGRSPACTRATSGVEAVAEISDRSGRIRTNPSGIALR